MALKTIFVGASTTGKTTMVKRIITKKFFDQSSCTIGASFIKYTSEHNPNIKYDFWDTAGQERFNSLLPMYFKGANILIFVFNVADMATANDFDKYIRIAYNFENLKILIVGNKIDLIGEEELSEINKNMMKKFGSYGINNRIMDYIFVSAKTGDNFDLLTMAMDKCAKTIDPITFRFDPANIILHSEKSVKDYESVDKPLIENPTKCSC